MKATLPFPLKNEQYRVKKRKGYLLQVNAMGQACHEACEDRLNTRSRKVDFKTIVKFMLVIFSLNTSKHHFLVGKPYGYNSIILNSSKYKARFHRKKLSLRNKRLPIFRTPKSLKVQAAFSLFPLVFLFLCFEKQMGSLEKIC